MTKRNGTLKTILVIIAILVTLALAGVSAVLNYGNQAHQVEDNKDEIEEIKPEVEKNTEHRHRFEEKVTNMDTKIDIILKAVQKNEP